MIIQEVKVLFKEKVALTNGSRPGGLNCVMEAEVGGSTYSKIFDHLGFTKMGTQLWMSVLNFAFFLFFDENYTWLPNYGTLIISRVKNATKLKAESQI